MRRLFFFPAATALLLASLTTMQARAAAPTVVSATVEPFVARVGERFTLTIVVDHEAGMRIEGPGPDVDFGGAEALDRVEPETVATGVGERTTLVYRLASFDTGPAVIPPLEIAWRGADGTSGTVTSPPAAYTIDSTVQPGDDSLRPLKPQLSIPQPAPTPAIPAAFVATMAGLTALGYWLVRRTMVIRPTPAGAPGPAPPPPAPDEVARQALGAIASGDLAERDAAAYYGAIATAVRQYLSTRFGFPAYAMTRREMERGMRRVGMDRWPARVTTNLLEQCDAVQFALFRPAMERRRQDLAAAYEIVRLTSGAGAAGANGEAPSVTDATRPGDE